MSTTPSAPDRDAALRALAAASRHPHKGPNDTDASMLLEAAKRLEGGYAPGGSNTSQMVARVCRVVAELLDAALFDAHPDTETPEASATVDLDPFIDRLAAAQYRDLDSHAASMSWDEYKADDVHGAAVLYRDPMRRYVLHSLPWLPTRPAPREAVEREALAKAWDEGYSHCFDFGPEHEEVRSLNDNPYRTPVPEEGGNENGSRA